MNKFFGVLKAFFAPPVFEGDEDKTRDARLLHQITLVSWTLPLLAFVIASLSASLGFHALRMALLLAIALVVITVLNRTGRVLPASLLLVGTVLFILTFLNYTGAAEPRPVLLLTVVAILMGGLLLGSRGALAAAFILILQNSILAALFMQGVITPQVEPATPLVNAIANGASYLLIGFLFSMAINRTQLVLNRVRQDEALMQDKNRELQELSTSLEQRVNERTQALSAVAEISTAASTILNTDKLLKQVADLAKERFRFYHAHIYLLNQASDTLVLSSGAGEVGREMVAKGHAIPLDREQSLVARAAREKKGVTVNDVTQTPDFLPNPLLPNTRSEMAVPMIVGEQVVGVFDVQSELVGRFTEADIAVQTTLASQVAAAVQNARSYAEIQRSQELLSEALNISRLANWEYDVSRDIFTFNDNFYSIFRTSVEKVGSYKLSSAEYAQQFVHPEDAPLVGGEIQSVLESKERFINKTLEHRIIFPDGEVGYISVKFSVERDDNGNIVRFWGANQDITERRRLEELNRKRAMQQEAINLITQRIQSASTVESALQVAARELGRVFGQKPTAIALESSAFGRDVRQSESD